jgi:CubicO group peptidase (beta-lactamase class C family)
MKWFFMIFVCAGLIAGSVQAEQQSDTVVKGELGAKLDAYMTRLNQFGFSGTLLVAKDGEIVVSKGYGLADRARKIPMTPETVISIGSITKQFTGAAILKLEMQGKLSVNDPITKFFSNVPADKSGITLHHLLTHTAGLDSDYGPSDYESVTRDEIVKRVFAEPLRSKPGEQHRYSNAGYSLLAAIVEIVSGQNYEQFLVENLFKPAGMFKTGYKLPQWNRDDIARGYIRDEDWGTIVDRPWAADGPYWNLRGNGGIHSTIGDMYRWHRALEGETVLSKEAKQKFFAPHVPEEGGMSHYGYGWAIFKTPRNTKLIAHNGGNGIFAADFLRYVDDGVVVYIASNIAEAPATQISSRIARIIFTGEYVLPPKVIELDAAALEKFAGAYKLSSGAELNVAVKAGRLAVTGNGQEAFCVLNAGGNCGQSRFTDLNRRTAGIFEKAVKKDFTALHEAFGGRMPLKQIEARESEMWQEWHDRFGPFKKFEVLGTAPMEGAALTYTRLEFERGSTFVLYRWEDGELAGIRGMPRLPGNTFLPESATDFVSFDIRSGAMVRISFDAATKSLIVHALGQDVRAQKV